MGDVEEEQIELPAEMGKTLSFECPDTDHLIWFMTLHQDPSVCNPCDDQDGLGTMHSLNSRHSNFNGQCDELLEEDKDAKALSYFEHGQCLWFVHGDSTPAGVEFRWDGVKFAGVWEPDKCIRESADSLGHKPGTPERDAWMREQAAACCKLYTCWCNGECYGYDIKVYSKRKHQDTSDTFDEEDDYRFDTPVREDACFGFFGWDEVAAACREALKDAHEALKPAEMAKEKENGDG